MKHFLIIIIALVLNSCFLFEKKTVDPTSALPTFNSTPIIYNPTTDPTTEVSGLVVARGIPNAIWVEEDSDNPAGIHLKSTTGQYLKYVSFYYNRDCEDIAIGPGPDTLKNYIYLADIGDNNATYSKYMIYRFLEPTSSQNSITDFETINFTYPDGKSYDAETLMIEPSTKDLYIVTKREFNVKVFRLKYPQSTSKSTVAEYLGTIPYFAITAGDISADGNEILIKSYYSVYYWKRKTGETIYQAISRTPDVPVPYIEEVQGEAIGWKYDASGFYCQSEIGGSSTLPPLYYYFKK